MNIDSLGQLLRQADREAGAPQAMPDDLAGRVRKLALRRDRVRFQSSVLALGLIVALGVLFGPRLQGNSGITPAPTAVITVSTTTAELLAIKTEAEQLRAEILAAQPAPVRLPAKPRIVRASVDEELERAAYLIVYQADRYHRELDMPESAIASYRQAIELFPGTRAAQTARNRLCQLENEKGHQS